MHREITENETLQFLVDSIEGYAIYMLDPEGRVATWNDGAARLEGYRCDEVVGQPFSRLFSAEDQERGEVTRVLERAEAEGSARTEGWRVRQDGSRFFAIVTLRPMFHDGELVGFGAVIHDASAEKREHDRQRFLAGAGALLAESLEDLEGTLTRIARLAVPDLADWAVVDVVRGERLERVAAAHRDPEREELAKRLIQPRRARTREEREPVLTGVLRTGKPALIRELTDDMLVTYAESPEQLEALRALGFRSWMSVPLVARGRVLGTLSFVMAESGRTLDESDMSFAQEVGRSAGLALDNARLYRDATAALRAREDFLAVAAHELRTPLTPLRLQLDALEREVASAQNLEEVSRRTEAMRRQVGRLVRLVNSLIAVARGHPLRVDRLERADLAELVGDVVERVQERAARFHTEVRYLPRRAVVGRFDTRAVEIIVEHLLDNALKYGRGEPVEVDVAAAGDASVVRVVDRGIGIEQADQERIFEKFARSVSSSHYGGLGLGLYIARELARAHGGTLSVESARGQGAAFTVVLPREVASQANDAQQGAAAR